MWPPVWRASSSFSASDRFGNEARNSASVPQRKAFIAVQSVETKKISGWEFFFVPMNSECVIRSKVAQGEGKPQQYVGFNVVGAFPNADKS